MLVSAPDFYLVYDDVPQDQEPTRCFVVRRLRSANRDDYLLVSIDAPVVVDVNIPRGSEEPERLREFANRRNVPSSLSRLNFNTVIIRARHVGSSVTPVSEWPTSVYVAVPLFDHPERRETFDLDESLLVAWGQVYRSEDEARAAGRADWSLREPDCYLVMDMPEYIQHPRACFRVAERNVAELQHGVPYLINPAISGERFGLGQWSIATVLIAPRDVQGNLLPIEAWPASVNVFHSLEYSTGERRIIPSEHACLIGPGSLYPTEEAAQSAGIRQTQ